jgi:hypothetical protein
MRRETEAGFMEAVMQLAFLLGWRVFHVRWAMQAPGGWPDLVLWHPPTGVICLVETKAEGGRVRVDQAAMLDQLDRLRRYDGAAVWRPSMWAALAAYLGDPLGATLLPGAWTRAPPHQPQT